MRTIKLIIPLILLLGILSCTQDVVVDEMTEEEIDNEMVETRAMDCYYFDWETVNRMPTHPNQATIAPPWSGTGSIVTLYGEAVLNDKLRSDGWELLYSEFTPEYIVDNPHFILYNKYRGTMRIFFYLTTQSLLTSTYLRARLTYDMPIGMQSKVLNFLGEELIKPWEYKKIYEEILPNENAGPVAPNRWYMVEYEIAYDPIVENIDATRFQFDWRLTYFNVENINLGGEMTARFEGLIGAHSTTNEAPSWSSMIDDGHMFWEAGKGVLASTGTKYLENKTINAETGENSLGLPKKAFKRIVSSVKNIKETALTGLKRSGISLLNMVIGGSSQGNAAVPITLSMDARIELTGEITSSGDLPGPYSFYAPGTQNMANAPHYVPLYNYPLGVVGFEGRPRIIIYCDHYWEYIAVEPYDPWWGPHPYFIVEKRFKYPNSYNILYEMRLIDQVHINPAVREIADVRVDCDLLLFKNGSYSTGGEMYSVNPVDDSYFIEVPTNEIYYDNGGPFFEEWEESHTDYRWRPFLDAIVRFAITVTPHDGSPATTILKAVRPDIIFKAKPDDEPYWVF